MFRALLALLFGAHAIHQLSVRMIEGPYRGALIINTEYNLEIPFNFDLKYINGKPVITIRNGDERIVIDEISGEGDSVNFKMPVFDSEFRTVKVKNDLEGEWINHSSNSRIRFKAVFGESRRFLYPEGKPDPYFEGKWQTTFSPGTTDSSLAIGVFHHLEQTDNVTGTFLTETGDYRYLEGMKSGDKLYLSTFDGAHAYLFVAERSPGDILNGTFYSGSHWKESWKARRNDRFELSNAEEITFVKNKETKINFSFQNIDKKFVSLSDKRFENKPVIIQVMGSWCPNCMDESRYLSGVYKQYRSQGLEIIALAFEKTNDFETARSRIVHMKDKLGMAYEILITQQTGKEKAGEVFGVFNEISAFPTTIFLDKQHQIVKVHTGFSGPATGDAYRVFAQRTDSLVQKLVKE